MRWGAASHTSEAELILRQEHGEGEHMSYYFYWLYRVVGHVHANLDTLNLWSLLLRFSPLSTIGGDFHGRKQRLAKNVCPSGFQNCLQMIVNVHLHVKKKVSKQQTWDNVGLILQVYVSFIKSSDACD